MNLLFIGDMVGKSSRKAAKRVIPEIRKKYNCSFVIANAENVAAGAGISEKCVKDLSQYINVITLGDHVWDQKNFENEIKSFDNVLRPSNLNPKQPGRGYGIFKMPAGGEIAVINLLGRTFMKTPAMCPFLEIDRILSLIPSYVKCILVDFHAEATSEKLAMGRYLEGKVTAVLGTHTHVQTADAIVWEKGTAYISDVGMVGAEDSILGREIDKVLYKFTTDMPTRLDVVEKGIVRFCAVVLSYDLTTGKASGITPISQLVDVESEIDL